MISASDAYKTRSHTPHFNATGLPLTPLESSLWFVISMNSFIMVCWIWSTKRSIKLWIKTATRLSKTTFYPLWPWPLGVVSSFAELFFDQQPLASRLSVGAVSEGGSSHPLGLTSTLGVAPRSTEVLNISWRYVQFKHQPSHWFRCPTIESTSLGAKYFEHQARPWFRYPEIEPWNRSASVARTCIPMNSTIIGTASGALGEVVVWDMSHPSIHK